MAERLAGSRILVTQADDYMGPAFSAAFESDFFCGQAIPFAGGWV
jgi:hypothetical protein